MKKITTLRSFVPVAALALASSGCIITSDDGDGGDGDGSGEGEGEGEGPVDLGNIDRDVTISEDITVDGDIVVRNGATLTIAPGVTIRFDSGHWLQVADGVLIAEGTEDEPITIRGVDDGVGRFLGLDFIEGTRSGTSLAFVIVDGGGASGFSNRACINIDGVPEGRISLVDVTMRNCEQAALYIDGDQQPLSAFDRITMESSLVGLEVNANLMRGIDEAVTVEGVTRHEILGDTVDTTATWVRQALPFHVVERDITIEGGAAPMVTIAGGNTLLFPPGKWLVTGNSSPGGLIADGTAEAPIVFGSVDGGTATKGAWLGVYFSSSTLSNSRLSHTTVESAGDQAFGVVGCITVDGFDDRVTLDTVRLAKCEQSGIGVRDGRSPFAAVDGLTIENSDAGIRGGLRAFTTIDELVTLVDVPHHLITDGFMDDDVTLVTQSVPFIFDDDIEVREGATLTIEAGNELRFPSDTWVSIGNSSAGRLVANGTAEAPVVFGSVDVGATAGAWLGLMIEDDTLSGTRLTHAVVKQAGDPRFGVRGGISLFDSGASVTLDNVTFANNEQADIFHSCDEPPTLVNTTGLVTNDCN